MKRAYSRDFSPPAPMLPLVVRSPGGTEVRHIEGKIDTGADVCALPDSVIADLDLPPVRSVRAAGFGGVLQEALLFHVDLEVAGRRSKHVEALSTRRPYAIIGRNILRQFAIKLDGPKNTLSITLPARSKHRPG